LTINNLKPNIGNEAHNMLMRMAIISRRRGLLSFSFGLLLTVLPVNSALSLDYTIKEVIEVGEAGFAPFVNPLIWSPDGTKLAFTKGGVIYVSDTLGNVQEVIRTEMPLLRWDWVTDSQIGVSMREFTGQGINSNNRLSIIDVNLKKETPLHNYTTFSGYRQVAGHSVYTGPFKTVEGNSYYSQMQYNTERGKETFIPHSFEMSKSETILNDHFLRWSDSGLYKVKIDQSDSTWLVGKPIMQTGPHPVASSDLTYAMDKGHLFRFQDTASISIDTLIGPLPLNTNACGIVWSSFNPVALEILFTITCAAGESNIINRIATLDCNTFQLTVIDTITGITNCAAPAFSPNGEKIAFMSSNKAYILTRQLE
jgi:hypothetical protein